MRPYVFRALTLVTVLLFVGVGYADRTRLHWVADENDPPFDRVVGVEFRCQQESAFVLSSANTIGFRDMVGGDPCNNCVRRNAVSNRLMEVAVRPPAGNIYRVTITPYRTSDDFPDVEIGDVWPPPHGIVLPQASPPKSCT